MLKLVLIFLPPNMSSAVCELNLHSPKKCFNSQKCSDITFVRSIKTPPEQELI